MKIANLVSILFLIVVMSSVSFADGFYDSKGVFTYYVSNQSPTIDVNISSGTRELRVEPATLTFNGEDSTINYDGSLDNGLFYMEEFANENFFFTIDDAITKNDDVSFALPVYDTNSNKKVKPEGDPIEFDIKYDDEAPELISVENMIESQGKVRFRFSEPVRYMDLIINGEEYTTYDNLASNLRLKSEGFIDIEFADDFFVEEVNELDIEFLDFAGNSNSDSSELLVRGEPLSIELLTIRDDDSLKYNFRADEDFKELFGNSLYSKSENFDIKVKTNKEATCYFSSALDEGTEFSFSEVSDSNKDVFETMDNFEHKFSLDGFDETMWVACKNKYYNEFAYLGEFIGIDRKEVLGVEVYDGPSVEIKSYEPKSLVSRTTFNLDLLTSKRAVCYYKIGTGENTLMENVDSTLLSFQKEDLMLPAGNYGFGYECYDVMNNKDEISFNLNVDPDAGVQVTDYSPKYSMLSNVNVDFSLSEGGVSCSYSRNKTSRTGNQSKTPVSGNGVSRNFNADLIEGDNRYYIYCDNGAGQTTENILDIVYDTKGAIITDLKFLNGEYLSDFVGSDDEIGFNFNVSSLIPIKRYTVRVLSSNGSEDFVFNIDDDEVKSPYSNSIRGDFSSANKLEIIATNLVDNNQSVEKVIKFDLSAPVITFSNNGGGKKIVCSDLESGCADVFYGLSATSLDCSAVKRYNGSIIDVGESNYICAKAYNNVNLDTFLVEDIYSDFEDPYENTSIDDYFNESEEENSSKSSGDEEEDLEDYEDPFKSESSGSSGESDGGGAALIGALALALFAGVGGGGYYAYKKGYLNKELNRLGINFGGAGSKNSAGANHKPSGTKFTTEPIKEVAKGNNSSNLKKGKYDSHLNKLNKFVDDKIRKSSDLFDKFDSSSKGKHEKYHDTLMKKKSKHSDVSKDDFDEFYSKSGDLSVSEKKSIEEEAESFEDYYKKKKGNSSKDKSKK